MAKVKKAGAVRKTRDKARTAKARTAASKGRGPAKRVAKETATRDARGKTKGKRVAAKRVPPKSIPLVSRFHVQALDPKEKCGPGTSVQQLYRIREEVSDGTVRPHLVFFDRHGWYCEHGRTCPAVPHAQKQGKHSRLPLGPTHNGRMRA